MTRTVVVSASMLVTTLVVALGASRTVSARGRWQDVLSPRGGGRAAVSSLGAEPRSTSDRSPERVRAPAPAPAQTQTDDNDASPARIRSSRVVDHDAGDRLREALAAAQDDPRSAARIQRLIAQAAEEARRNRALGERVWYWRDPFSEHPRRPIVLSLEVQLEMQLWQARQELARAHVASISARVEAAAAHVEAARARVEAARVDGTTGRARPSLARQDNRSMRGIDEEALLAPPRRAGPAVAGEGDSDGPAVRRRPARRATAPKTALARNEAAGSPGNRHRDIGAAAAVAAPVPATDSEEPRTDPATWRSADPRGIVIVPINTAAPTNPTLARRR
jgi:hypothetical protein